ncbi:hypothetical protein ACFX1Q_027445 [Malus domestica]
MGIVEEAYNVGVVGSGQQVLVLAHGIGTDQSIWKYLVPHLVDDNRVIMYDNMGAGTTNPEYFDFERYSTLEGYTYDLLAILEELHVKSCIFVGHSSSAMVGAIAAVTRPDLFTKLIMIAASPRSGATILGDPVQLQGMVLRVHTVGGGWRHRLSGGPGVQPDPIQQATGHCPQRHTNCITNQHETNTYVNHGSKSHFTECKRPCCLYGCFQVLGSGGSTILSTYWTLDLGEKEKESMRLSSWELKRLIKEGWEDGLIKDRQQSSASMQI